jgi:hypothetical protein
MWTGSPYRLIVPWSLAEIARVSLLYGNEFKRAGVGDRDVVQCCEAYSAIRDPDRDYRHH